MEPLNTTDLEVRAAIGKLLAAIALVTKDECVRVAAEKHSRAWTRARRRKRRPGC
jgi:hypothetical protein